MYKKVDLDLVMICSPPQVHREPTILAAEKGIPVFSEKPMAPSLEDCDAMIHACKDAGVPLYLGFIRRFDPGFERLRKAVQAGDLGDVFHIETVYNYFMPDHKSPPYSTILDWLKRHFGYDIDESLGLWRVTDPNVSGGIFQDHGPHYADLYRWILGDEVEMMSGFCQKKVESRRFEDDACVLLKFKKGASAFLQVGLNAMTGREWREYGVFHGTKASMRFSISSWWFVNPFFSYSLAKLFHRNRISKFSIYNYPLNIWSPIYKGLLRRRWMGDRQMSALIAALQGDLSLEKKAQLATGIDGRRAMEVVLGAYRSSKQGVMVRPEELH
jgi:predicted dehydrogenase